MLVLASSLADLGGGLAYFPGGLWRTFAILPGGLADFGGLADSLADLADFWRTFWRTGGLWRTCLADSGGLADSSGLGGLAYFWRT